MHYMFLLVLSFVTFSAIAASPLNSVSREYVFDSCHFKLMDPYNGRIDVDNESSSHSASYIALIKPELRHSVEVSIRFTCDTAEGMRAFTELGFDNQSGVWKLIPNEYDPENLARVKLYPLTGNGTSGVASTDDQTTGEETERTQGLAFCLTNQKQILCGTSQAVGYLAYPEESSLPQVLKLLESIEFLEPAPSTAP